VVWILLAGCGLLRKDANPNITWKFNHVVIDSSPPATYRINDIQIGDFNSDNLPDIWTSGRGAGENAYQMVWYQNPSWERHEIAAGDYKYGNLGDLDGDGDLDIVADQFWFENTGYPEQKDWPKHALGFTLEPDLMLIGDLNQDGRLDIVFNTKNELYWLPGPNDPQDEWISYLVGKARVLTGSTLADLDLDGDLDIIWGNTWVENPPEPTTVPWPMHTIDESWVTEARSAVGDLNGDGRPDIVLSGEESRMGVAWYAGPADSKTEQWVRQDIVREEYVGVHSLQVADFDLDGDLDIFAAEMHRGTNPDKITVFENIDAASNTWSEHILDSIGSHNAKVGDLNGDGYPDITGKNYEAGDLPLQVDVWFNDPGIGAPPATPTVQPIITPMSEPPTPSPIPPTPSVGTLPVDQWDRHIIEENRPWRAVFITGGDINGDDLPDIIAGGWWYENPGDLTGDWIRHDIGGELYNMAVVYDFDADGDLDILGTNGQETGKQFSWAENDGTGNFSLYDNLLQGNGDYLQGARVMPGETSRVILSWHDETSTQALEVPTQPTGKWTWQNISSTTNGEQVAIGDIDRDGDLDIHLGTVWLRNDHNLWTPLEAVTLGDPEADPDRVELADIDGDGDLDVVIGVEHAQRVVWGEAPADPTTPWTEHVITTDHDGMSLDVADLDLDGDMDVVVGEHTGQGRLFIYQNQDQGSSWIATQIDSNFEHHDGARLVDIDNDGDLDIISTGWKHSRIVLYENQAIDEDSP